jgi:hypothetical protein
MGVQTGNPDFSQPDNQLSKIADEQRKKLLPQNAFSIQGDKYSATHPDALSDGDDIGRGTGGFLDIYGQNIGTRIDVISRKDDIIINKYSQNNPYYNPK